MVFFCGRFWNYLWVPGYAFLLLCFSAFCFSCFSASLLFCFCALPASFLFCFSAFPAFVLLCLSTSTILLFLSSGMCFCCSTSCSSAFLLPVFTASFFSVLLLYSLLFVNTLGETQRNVTEILIRTPDKKPYMKPK